MANKNAALLSVLTLLAACGGGGDSNGNGGALSPSSSSSSSSTSVGKFIYIANSGASDITAYAINATTGALTGVAGAPFSTGASTNVHTLAAHPSSKFLYATNVGNATVATSLSAFSINATTGSLSLVQGSPYAVGLPSASIPQMDTPFFHPDGKFLFERKVVESKIFGYSVDQTTGALTPLTGSPLPFNYLPGIFNKANKLYYSNGTSMLVYGIDSVTGSATSLGSVPNSQPGAILTFDANNRYLYSLSFSGLASLNPRTLAAFSINSTSGLLTAVSGSPYPWPATQSATSNSPGTPVVHPSGKFVYVIDSNVSNGTPLGNSNITLYSVDQLSGALTAIGSPISTGGNYGIGIQIYKNGQFLLVTNMLSDSIAIFSIDQNTGVLTHINGSPFATPGTSPGIVLIEPSGKFAYLTDSASNTITQFTINTTTGTLTAGSNYPTGPIPYPVPFIVGLQ